METQLKFSVVLPLKQMTLRRLSGHLASDSDMLASIFQVQIAGVPWNGENRKQWRDIDGEMKVKMQQVSLPDPLRKEVSNLVRPVALQVRRWDNCHEFHLSNEEKSRLFGPSNLSWTTAGVIGYRKTAEQLLHCDALSIEQRYQLACRNCLEDAIPQLWERLPEESKNRLLTKHSLMLNLDSCWPRIIRGELSELDHLLRESDRNLTSFNQWAFEHSAQKGNRVATEYFLLKLTENERNESLMRTVTALLSVRYTSSSRNEATSEVCCYLMSLLSPERQAELVRARPVDVLFCFLDLPWLDLFSENAGLVWNLIPQSQFDDLLMKMVYRYEMTDHHFPKMFHGFFAHSTLDFRKFFVGHVSGYGMTPASNFLSLFFSSDDAESVEVLFRNVEPDDRVNLVFDEGLLCLLYEVFLMERLHLVEVCLQEAALSDEQMERLKETFTEFYRRNGSGRDENANSDLSQFFDLLDGANKESKGQKRKLENDGAE